MKFMIQCSTKSIDDSIYGILLIIGKYEVELRNFRNLFQARMIFREIFIVKILNRARTVYPRDVF